MRRRHTFSCWLVALILGLLVLGSYAQMSAKNKVSSQADLSGFTYPVKGSASVRCEVIWIGKARSKRPTDEVA
jgi:hypothetical protein